MKDNSIRACRQDLGDAGFASVRYGMGFEAVILSGVVIGDGAIIGTRAVVTKDMPPYTIVGGVPAKSIRKRFSDDVISELLKIQWWNWSENRIKKNIAMIQSGQIEDLK